MDYLLFHSQYSPSSKKLFDEFPMLKEKAISVDSVAMRAYVKKIHVVCVPTLLVLLGNRVIDRVIGYESIYNWLVTTLYRMGQLQASSAMAEPDLQMDMIETPQSVMTPPVMDTDAHMSHTYSTGGATSLDDLVLEDIPTAHQTERETPLVSTGMSANTMMVAEALKKERDNIDPNANKKKFSQ
jgi:multisubunit Na+/H+ antiporter MnhF subunit